MREESKVVLIGAVVAAAATLIAAVVSPWLTVALSTREEQPSPTTPHEVTVSVASNTLSTSVPRSVESQVEPSSFVPLTTSGIASQPSVSISSEERVTASRTGDRIPPLAQPQDQAISAPGDGNYVCGGREGHELLSTGEWRRLNIGGECQILFQVVAGTVGLWGSEGYISELVGPSAILILPQEVREVGPTSDRAEIAWRTCRTAVAGGWDCEIDG